ncbi:MAG: 2-oxoacid:acceptor oxidoreductase family protein [Candidatus Hodarchaeota archaeon]
MQQIRLCGGGGQGIVVAGRILAEAAFLDKRVVSLTAGYGTAMRGGISKSDIVLSDSFIDFPMVTQIDLLLSMLEEAYQESLPMVNENGVIVLDDTTVKPSPTSSIEHYSIPATEIAIQELKNEMVANLIMLAAANSIGRLVSKTSLEESIKSIVSPRFVEINLQAIQLGLDLAKKLIV